MYHHQDQNKLRGVTLRQWRAFSLVAKHRSFARAAKELHLTPSAVSLQIKEVERAVGLTLLMRNAREVTLTTTGELLLADINRALQALKDADDKVARLRGQTNGTVTLGLVSNAQYFLPRVLARFQDSYPAVEVRTAVGNREQLLRMMCHGEVDLAIMGQPPRDLDIHAEAFASQPLGVLASPEHVLSTRSSLPAAVLKEHPFVVRERGSGTRAAMERFFNESQIRPRVIMEMSSNELIKQAVIANMGLGFLSLHTAVLELPKQLLVALDIEGLPIVKHWYVARLGSSRCTAAAEALRGLIAEEGRHIIEKHFGGIHGKPPSELNARVN